MNKLVFVTRATKTSGKGHFYRTLRMAQALKGHRNCIIVVDEEAIDLNHGRDVLFKALDVDKPESILKSLQLKGDDIVWFDLPDSIYPIIKRFQGGEVPLISMNMFDKVSELRYEDVAIYPVFSPTGRERLTRPKDLIQLSGADFISVPDSFFSETHYNKGKTVLVSMGGTDPMGFTLKVLSAIASLDYSNFQFKVILPTGLLKKQIVGLYKGIAHLEFYDFGQLNFSDELKAASYALINGGMTRYECIAAKTFFIALSIHEQQESLTEKATKYGYGYNFGVFGDSAINRLTKYLKKIPEKPTLPNGGHSASIPSLKKNSATWIYKQVLAEINNENK